MKIEKTKLHSDGGTDGWKNWAPKWATETHRRVCADITTDGPTTYIDCHSPLK
jgi:hypothetical protein